MSSEKEFIARLQQKHDIEENWKKAVNFVPKMAEIIVYDPDETNTKSRFKIGDGETNVNELPFFTSSGGNGGTGTGIGSLGDLGINVSADVLNYMEGVTSNVQEQLNARVKTINKQGPDADGDVSFSYIKTINGYGPDESGNINIIGGGSNSTYTPAIQDVEGTSRSFTIIKGNSAILKIKYTSTDANGHDDGDGSGQILKDGVVQQNFRAEQNKELPIEVTSLLSIGDNQIVIKITNTEGATVTAVYAIRVVVMSLTANFRNKIYYGTDNKVQFVYTVSGPKDTKKTFHLQLDNNPIYTQLVDEVNNGLPQSYSFSSLSYGAHTIKAWFECELEKDEEPISSNSLYYTIIYAATGQYETVPVVAFIDSDSLETNQYETYVIRYLAYDPNSDKCKIILSVNGDNSAGGTQEVGRTEQTWSYYPTTYGDLTLKIESEKDSSVVDTCVLTVKKETLSIGSGVSDFELFLSSQGRSNSDVDRDVWISGDIQAKLDGFNFTTNGWVLDDKNNIVLKINGSARLKIPLKLFENDLSEHGKTLELDFKVTDILNPNQTIVSCHDGQKGFKITAEQIAFSGASSSVGVRYKENEHIRISFVVQSSLSDCLLMCYVNGILTSVQQYSGNGGFKQNPAVEIEVGSSYCTIDLYNIRVYGKELTRHQIVQNWVADTQDYQEKIKRHVRNNIFVPGDYGTIQLSSLPADLPYLIFQCEKLPKIIIKDGKEEKEKVDVSGSFVNPSNKGKSFTFNSGKVAIQGTSSAAYYRKNYKFNFGTMKLDGGTGEEVTSYAMNDNAVPVDTFTLKADAASSESALNVVLSMLYNDLCPYKTPPQDPKKNGNPNIRQCIEGFPCLVFWRQKAFNSQDIDNSNVPLQFFGKYNFNNDKGTEEVFGFKPGDESWEIRANGNALSMWKESPSLEEKEKWSAAFEIRYQDHNGDQKEDKPLNYKRLKKLSEWLVSTRVDQATNKVLPESKSYEGIEYTKDTEEYRLAKFKEELKEYFDENSIIFYYLFTEVMLCIDQREKNAFPTFFSEKDEEGKEVGRWRILFYDADSSCGTDNQGNLSKDYYLEDGDLVDDKHVYNGHSSTLWDNLRATKDAKITEMYQDLRAKGLDYDTIIKKFENHQGKWPESIFNEDTYTKYINPILNKSKEGEAFFEQIHGKKELWLKYWLYNRFRYLDSKYSCGDATSHSTMIRSMYCGPTLPIKMTFDKKMYGQMSFNKVLTQTQRMDPNVAYDFAPEADGEDPVITIYNADLVTELTNLAPLKVKTINTVNLPRLRVLELGAIKDSNGEVYNNELFRSLDLKNNTVLENLNLENCSGLGRLHKAEGDLSEVSTSELLLDNCVYIKNINLRGTSLQKVALPSTGSIETLYLPNTIKTINLENQPNLKEFMLPSDAVLEYLVFENTPVIDSYQIFQQVKSGASLSMKGIDWTFEDLTILDKLFSMKGKDGTGNADITGKIHFKTSLPHDLYLICKRKFPYLTITADDFTLAEALTVSGTDYKYFVTAEGKFIRFVDGGHKTSYSGQSIDECFDKINQKGVIMKYE